jgi:glutamate--glyoxylate aminotransferase
MCIRCLAKSSAVSGGARQLLNSWQCSLGAAEAAPKVAGARLFSSAMPEPVVDAPAPNSIDGKVAHPSLLNQDLLKAQYAVRGELYNKALELQKQGRDLIFTNGGAIRVD